MFKMSNANAFLITTTHFPRSSENDMLCLPSSFLESLFKKLDLVYVVITIQLAMNLLIRKGLLSG